MYPTLMGKKNPFLHCWFHICDSDTSMDNTDGEVFLKKQTGLSDAFVSFTENLPFLTVLKQTLLNRSLARFSTENENKFTFKSNSKKVAACHFRLICSTSLCVSCNLTF